MLLLSWLSFRKSGQFLTEEAKPPPAHSLPGILPHFSSRRLMPGLSAYLFEIVAWCQLWSDKMNSDSARSIVFPDTVLAVLVSTAAGTWGSSITLSLPPSTLIYLELLPISLKTEFSQWLPGCCVIAAPPSSNCTCSHPALEGPFSLPICRAFCQVPEGSLWYGQ